MKNWKISVYSYKTVSDVIPDWVFFFLPTIALKHSYDDYKLDHYTVAFQWTVWQVFVTIRRKKKA